MRVPLLWHFVKQDILTRYSGSVLGTLWLFANPLVQILIFVMIFGTILGSRVGADGTPFGYGFYLMAGVLPWTAFTGTVGRTATAFIDKAGMISKISLRLSVVAVHMAISEGLVLAGILVLLIVVMALLGKPPTPALFCLPLLVFFQQLIAFCLGLAGAMITVFVRDTKEVIALTLQIWFWLTPIVYPISGTSPMIQAVQRYNPAFWFVDAYHTVLVSGAWPDLPALGAKTAALLLVATVLLWGLAKVERDIRDLL